MKAHIETETYLPEEPSVGAVYAVRGGRGAKLGRMMVLFAIAQPKSQYDGEKALMLIINKDGTPAGVTSYGMHCIRDLTPIARADGIADFEFTIRSL